ncbi:MAG: GNAT family N-acetyltransferase [Acidimicrobiia bacterium]|nr:GNAT family N-acetyltransferase [Acidimicrobiia bacterium]
MILPPGTERIRFRPYQREDVALVLEMFSDPDARRFYPSIDGPQAAETWIAWSRDLYDTTGFGMWAIEHVETGEFLGDCGLTLQPVEGESMLEVGYHLTQSHRGRGYATEAGIACRNHAFEVLGSSEVCSVVDPMNEASRAVASRIHAQSRTFTNHEGREMCLYWTSRPSGLTEQ